MEMQARPFTARSIPGALRSAMVAKNYTGSEVATRAGLSRQIVWLLSTGRRSHCNPETAGAIAKAMGMPTEYLFMLEPSQNTATLSKVAA